MQIVRVLFESTSQKMARLAIRLVSTALISLRRMRSFFSFTKLFRLFCLFVFERSITVNIMNITFVSEKKWLVIGFDFCINWLINYIIPIIKIAIFFVQLSLNRRPWLIAKVANKEVLVKCVNKIRFLKDSLKMFIVRSLVHDFLLLILRILPYCLLYAVYKDSQIV